MGVGSTADVAVERELGGFRCRLGNGQRRAEDGVGAELALVGRAVELDERLVYGALVGGLHADERIGDLFVYVVDSGEHAFAKVASGLGIPQLDGFELAGRGARRNRCTAEGAIV